MAKRGAQAGRPTRQGGQVRQVRQVRQPAPAQPAGQPQRKPTARQQRRQRRQYVESGGLLQGYAPKWVLRISYLGLAGAILCAAVIVVVLVVLPLSFRDLDWPSRVIAAVAWALPIGFAASFLLPGWRLARKDLRAEPTVIQGQLMGSSPVSTSFGLGMLMVKTRGSAAQQQYLVSTEKLARVPGNQVPVLVTMTPNLHHVKSIGIVGQRLAPRPEQPVPAVMGRLRLLPIATPVGICLGAIVGTLVIALLPIENWLLHAILTFLVGAALAAGIYGLTFLIQRRLYAQVQALLPGGM
ncbi:MAG: hypothetical protein ACREQM_06275 [Candidatus Dormibacteraceae bacterium]